jgi:hypothetical protein
MIPSYMETFPLLEALRSRRSRRFARGLTMPPRGALVYQSHQAPQPLSETEEALLAFAACGVTGHALADLPLGEGEGGNIMLTLLGRTVASGDAAQTVAMVVINDDGAHLVRRPRELPIELFPELVRLAQTGDYTELYRRARVRISGERREPPRTPLFNIGVNKWVAGAAGTTTFLPINDLSCLYINGLLELFNEETRCFVLDDRAGFRPAGLGRFARSKGGHLENDPARERLATVQRLELIILDVVAIEQGMMHQNLALMTEAMGLGGFPSFAEHEYGWFEALGFHMGSMSATRYLGGDRLMTLLARLLGKDAPASYPLGLERDGQVLLRAMTPPYFSSMAEAVRYVGEQKTGARGFFRGRAGETAWQGGARVAASLPPISDKAVAATTAYCEYLWARYGRLPVNMAPFRTVLRFQAAHLDKEFYERFYRPGALGAAHYGHQARWHEAE